MATSFVVEDHLRGRDPVVAAIYEALTKAAARLGPIKVEAKKTSIHLVRSTAFAGVATRKASLILTLKAARDIKSPRVTKHEQTSASRWHLEVRLESPREVDAEIKAWLKDAYELSG
ncbi:MAG: DUF5655 domain-containing protein [Candidatus Eisenbacteria bacterium]